MHKFRFLVVNFDPKPSSNFNGYILLISCHFCALHAQSKMENIIREHFVSLTELRTEYITATYLEGKETGHMKQ